MEATIKFQADYHAALDRIQELTGALEDPPEERALIQLFSMSRFGGRSISSKLAPLGERICDSATMLYPLPTLRVSSPSSPAVRFGPGWRSGATSARSRSWRASLWPSA